VANRLREWKESGLWPQVPVGINIGKSRTVDVREATADYLQSFRRLQAFADYVVLNVSSPNTPDLRLLQDMESLSELLSAIVDENRLNKPILVKVAPDLADSDLDDVIAACAQYGAEGIIATNTTIDHTAIPESQDEPGGLSGAPLRDKSTAIVRAICNKCRLPVIGCGGIMDGASAREKVVAGAELVQLYTGLIYRGPGLLQEVSAAINAAA
jgi:dihydroorotate dehydrogenase